MIELNKISFRYPNSEEIFNNLSLKIYTSSIVAIVGSSGCGKSTLLNLIAGLLKPTQGNIAVGTKNIAYLMQDVTLLPYMNVRENVILAYTLRNNSFDKENINRANNLLQLFQIGPEDYEKFPSELSGGMKQKIALAQTLLTNPKLLLLDEPFTGIDILAQSDIENIVYNHLKKNGITMVFITHNIEQAIMLSDRVVILKNNSISGDVMLPADFVKDSPFRRRTKKEECEKHLYEVIQKI